MLRYIKGNLVTALLYGDVDFIGHQCNCFNTMRRGIAKEIASKIPTAVIADSLTIKGDKSKLGTFTYDSGVYNLYGQYKYGTGLVHTDYVYLRAALTAMRNDIDNTAARVAFPKLGCGLAGGSWDIVSNIIQEVFNEYDNIFIYEL
jgi:O-acetyl-ADP-ribose deacetylase (regulator of RNase III)